MQTHFNTIDAYILSFPASQQKLLQEMRRIVRKAAPNATEAISYGMPTLKLNGNLVHFALAKKHMGFYPTPSAINAFRNELAGYTTSKGAVQFPLNEPLPADLIKEMVLFRVSENGGLLTALSAPARRALESKRIDSVKILSEYTEKEILSLHGIGKTSIPVLKAALKKQGLSFKE